MGQWIQTKAAPEQAQTEPKRRQQSQAYPNRQETAEGQDAPILGHVTDTPDGELEIRMDLWMQKTAVPEPNPTEPQGKQSLLDPNRQEIAQWQDPTRKHNDQTSTGPLELALGEMMNEFAQTSNQIGTPTAKEQKTTNKDRIRQQQEKRGNKETAAENIANNLLIKNKMTEQTHDGDRRNETQSRKTRCLNSETTL